MLRTEVMMVSQSAPQAVVSGKVEPGWVEAVPGWYAGLEKDARGVQVINFQYNWARLDITLCPHTPVSHQFVKNMWVQSQREIG